MVLLSAQLAIIISLEPACSLLGVEKSFPESAASKMEVLSVLTLHQKLVRKSQCIVIQAESKSEARDQHGQKSGDGRLIWYVKC